MARIVVIGGGMIGSCAAMMLAGDGHEVTVLERDPAPPPPPGTAWDEWERRGVNQFRMVHLLLARFRQVADAELPGLTDALADAGGLRMNPVTRIPEQFTGGARPDDERFTQVTARRPVAESVVGALLAATPGVRVRRGVGVTGLLAAPGPGGIVHVGGVRTDAADGGAAEVPADLVIDAGGRRSALPALLREAGSPGPREEIADCGFVYYGRHYRSPDGSVPAAFGPPLQHCGTISLLALPADNGTWGVAVVTSAKDASMRALADPAVWEAVVRAHPLVAHWTNGEPISDVKVMAKIEDRRRAYVVDGDPVATGVVALGDAWACTNPSLGRGISIGMVQASAVRRLVTEDALREPREFALRWAATTDDVAAPYVDETLAFDRHRLAQIDAFAAGRPYESDDPTWVLGQALRTSGMRDPELLRGNVEVGMVLATQAEVLARPGLAERAVAMADPSPLPGPDRAALLALAGA